jgi:hypothetical protein
MRVHFYKKVVVNLQGFAKGKAKLISHCKLIV